MYDNDPGSHMPVSLFGWTPQDSLCSHAPRQHWNLACASRGHVAELLWGKRSLDDEVTLSNPTSHCLGRGVEGLELEWGGIIETVVHCKEIMCMVYIFEAPARIREATTIRAVPVPLASLASCNLMGITFGEHGSQY